MKKCPWWSQRGTGHFRFHLQLLPAGFYKVPQWATPCHGALSLCHKSPAAPNAK